MQKNRIYLFVFSMLLVTACQTPQKTLPKLLGFNDNLVYHKVEQGYFQESLYRADFYSGIDISFDVYNRFPGNYTPLTGVSLHNSNSSKAFYIKVLMSDNGNVIQLESFDNKKIIDSSSIPLDGELKNTANKLQVSWTDDSVFIRFENYENQLPINFEVDYIAHITSSMEILKRIKLYERKNNNS
ncbi:hypothetical protein [Pleionea sediminis]|uniref:hypothetical protein n=1 Tax=Pleionea sediminis TaxID=2569479 RepID=UPI00118535CF|nr:hypothetical protein [Pleionea sediminis]